MVTSGPDRRDAVLRHIARYGLTLRPVLASLFYDQHENALDRDLDRMREYGWISAVEGAVPEAAEPHIRYSYYQLATTGARRIGAAKSRARKLGGEALSRGLAFLWFCCMQRARRHRLNEQDLVDLFGRQHVYSDDPADNERLRLRGFHCLDRHREMHRVLNLYAPRTSPADVLAELRKRIHDLRKIPIIAEAMEAHKYGFAILTETEQFRDALRAELTKPLSEEGVVFVLAKSPGTWKDRRVDDDQ